MKWKLDEVDKAALTATGMAILTVAAWITAMIALCTLFSVPVS